MLQEWSSYTLFTYRVQGSFYISVREKTGKGMGGDGEGEFKNKNC